MSNTPHTSQQSNGSPHIGGEGEYHLMGTDMNTPLKQQQQPQPSEGQRRGHHPTLSLGNVTVDEEAGQGGTFSFMVALAFCCNYCMGTGFLTLPWAFAPVGGCVRGLFVG
jgi:hypothetical protein